MAKYIRVLFYAVGIFIAITAIAETSKMKFRELDLEQDATPVFQSLRDKQRQLACMTQNVYWEAANEPPEGKIAVAQVVMNRVESGQFPNDPCQVIYQKSVVYSNIVCQFSWACDRASQMKPVHKDLWRESQEAAKMVLLEGFRLPSLKGALYYHADYINPKWGKKKVAHIGRHIFYNREKADGRT
jgi:hypothetical protein